MNTENSYTPEFFNELFSILGIEDQTLKLEIKKQISISARSYIRGYNFYNSLSPHKIKKELEKALHHIENADPAGSRACPHSSVL